MFVQTIHLVTGHQLRERSRLSSTERSEHQKQCMNTRWGNWPRSTRTGWPPGRGTPSRSSTPGTRLTGWWRTLYLRAWPMENLTTWKVVFMNFVYFLSNLMKLNSKFHMKYVHISHHTLNSKTTAIIIKMFYFQVLGSHFLTELTTIPSLTSPLTRSIRFWWRQALLRSGLNYRKTSEWAKIKWEMSWRKWDRLWVQHLWQERSMRCGWD